MNLIPYRVRHAGTIKYYEDYQAAVTAADKASDNLKAIVEYANIDDRYVPVGYSLQGIWNGGDN